MEKEETPSGPQIPTSGRIVPLSERQQMALLKKNRGQAKTTAKLKVPNRPAEQKGV